MTTGIGAVPTTFAGLQGARQPASLLDSCFSYVSTKVVTVKDFGAVGNGVSDDTIAIQAAITAVQALATGGEIYFPPGTYLVSSTLNITGGLRLRGAGRNQSVLTWTSTTLNVISIASVNAVEILSLGFTGPASATAGAVIALSGTVGVNNTFSIFRDLNFTNGWDWITTDKAWGWTIDNCRGTGALNRAILVQNTLNPDFGDSTIEACLFYNMGASATHVQQVSSGGLRIINNKFLSGAYGYRMILASGITTADLLITGNSIENQTVAGIQLNTAGSNSFVGVVITGNEIANQPAPIALTDATAFMSEIDITGNVVFLAAAGGTGIAVTNSTDFQIANNTIRGQGGTVTGISVGSSSSNGQIGINRYASVSNPIVNASVTTNLPAAVPLGLTGVAVTAPANTSENILATLKLGAAQMGLNGRVTVQGSLATTNSVNHKTIKVRVGGIGGTVIATCDVTTADVVAVTVRMTNRGATNAQFCWATFETNGAGISPTSTTTAIVTTSAQDIVITGTKDTAGEFITLNDASATLIPA